MSKRTIYLMGIISTIIIGSVLYWYLYYNASQYAADMPKTNTAKENVTKDGTNKENGTKHGTAKEKAAKDNMSMVVKNVNPFSISGAGFEISTSENLNFNTSGHAVLVPVSETLKGPIEKLKHYMTENPSKVIKVLGYFKNDETNTSSFLNLGLARAEAIKKEFVSKGISIDRILVSGAINEDLVPDDLGVLRGPFSLVLDENEIVTERDALKNALTESPNLANFSSGKHSHTINSQNERTLSALADYLNTYGDSSCTIVGYCDSDGSEANNIALGQRRADFTKRQLLKLNVDNNKIKTVSKGESDPIATNTTAAGKAKNRRTELKIN